MNKSVFITVRTNSSRLKNKALLEIKGKSTIEHLIDRMRNGHNGCMVQGIDNIVLCTTMKKEDDVLCELAVKKGIDYVRGSEKDKLKRWLLACKTYDVDFFVTVDGDDLFCDPHLIELALKQYKRTNTDFIKSSGLAIGAFTYGIKREALEKVCAIKTRDDTEMMWVYFEDTDLFQVEELQNVPDVYKRPQLRMTLDYEDDFKFFDKVISHFGHNRMSFIEITDYLNSNRDIIRFNSYLEKKWKSLQESKTIDVRKNKGWRFTGNEKKYLNEVLDNGFGASETGAMIERLETLFAEKHNQKYAIGFNSGTSTLHTALESFGVGEGDEVIVPALTPAMCGFSIWQTGATPVFADVREDTFLMDMDDVEDKITGKTKAIMPVHIYGLMCDMEQLLNTIKKWPYSLYIVEVCAECFLATDNHNSLAGTIGDVGSWSFENSKHLSSGDGGIVTTNNKVFAKRMRQFGGVGFKNITADSGKVRISRDKFQDPNWERHNVMAYNYRMPELCAAVALAQTENIDEFCEKRIQMGLGYEEVIKDTGTKLLIPQKTPEGYKHSYYTFSALYEGEKYGIPWQSFRKKYIELDGDGIYAAWKTQNREPAFKDIGWGDVPVAEKLQKNLMQFTTNQANELERNIQLYALRSTIEHFDK